MKTIHVANQPIRFTWRQLAVRKDTVHVKHYFVLQGLYLHSNSLNIRVLLLKFQTNIILSLLVVLEHSGWSEDGFRMGIGDQFCTFYVK